MEYLTAKEVYQYLGISKTTFFRHGYATKLKSYCIGNRNKFKKQDIDRFMESLIND